MEAGLLRLDLWARPVQQLRLPARRDKEQGRRHSVQGSYGLLRMWRRASQGRTTTLIATPSEMELRLRLENYSPTLFLVFPLFLDVTFSYRPLSHPLYLARLPTPLCFILKFLVSLFPPSFQSSSSLNSCLSIYRHPLGTDSLLDYIRGLSICTGSARMSGSSVYLVLLPSFYSL